jgi:hypothetical protein
MNSSAFYRARAEQYQRAAEEADDPNLCEQFEVLASDYAELAEDAMHGVRNTKKRGRQRTAQ